MMICYFFFFKQKTAYEMRISDWSSDVCSSDLGRTAEAKHTADEQREQRPRQAQIDHDRPLYGIAAAQKHVDHLRGGKRGGTDGQRDSGKTKRAKRKREQQPAARPRLRHSPSRNGSRDRKSTRLNSSH